MIFDIIESMKRTIFIILGLIYSLAVFPLFAQENNESKAGSNSADAFAIIPELECEEIKDIEPSRTKVTFKANVKNCEIQLNGNKQGKSNLTLINLVEGYYLLRAEKEGYLPKENFVYIEHGKDKTFYIELEPKEETKNKEDSTSQSNSEPAANENLPAQESSPASLPDSGDAK